MSKNQWSRREFLKFTGAAACTTFLPGCAHTMKTTETEFAVMPFAETWAPHVASAWMPKG